TADFWLAKTHYALHQLPQAVGELGAIARAGPTDYYAFRARHPLSLLCDSLSHFSPDTSANIDAARRWLDSITPLPARTLLPPDSQDLVRGAFLVSIGYSRIGQYFIDNIMLRNPENLGLPFDCALTYARCGQFFGANRLARKLVGRIPQQNRLQAPGAITALLYPSFYRACVDSNAARRKVSPALVTAIIRQESMFDPAALSPVGAIGLMQIMPATGALLARDLGGDFSPDSLYKAEFNIRYGTYYVQKLLDQFSGSAILMLASYNSGANNAEQWYALNKDDDEDMFVENIAFNETRDYVKKVLANYWMYEILEGQKTIP
ncbi:MAG: lytic transglycosylase domain-containing protein, partial [Chitinivibrionales bacterium]|nr:lytic transglycosylase domain-containing protein [Chitinivibrionales bacterium]